MRAEIFVLCLLFLLEKHMDIKSNLQFIKLPKVIELTGKSRSAIYLAIKKGEFPQPIAIGSRAVAWLLDSIVEWQKSCIDSKKFGGEK